VHGCLLWLFFERWGCFASTLGRVLRNIAKTISYLLYLDTEDVVKYIADNLSELKEGT